MTSLKCSVANTWTAWSDAIAVPTAFVPAVSSLHRAPSTKLSSSAALERTRGLPSIHSSLPSASVTTNRCWAASTISASNARKVDTMRASGCSAQTSRTSSASITDSDSRCVASTPALAHRCHDSVMGARRSSGGEAPLRNPSHARRTSRARATGLVAASIASHGFGKSFLGSSGCSSARVKPGTTKSTRPWPRPRWLQAAKRPRASSPRPSPAGPGTLDIGASHPPGAPAFLRVRSNADG